MAVIPTPAPQPNASDDSLAKQEAEYFTARPEVAPLAEQSKRQLALEIMDLRKVMFWGARLFARAAFFLLILAVVTWWWHLIGWKGWRWLEQEEIDHLQALITSGAVGALITAVWKKLLN